MRHESKWQGELDLTRYNLTSALPSTSSSGRIVVHDFGVTLQDFDSLSVEEVEAQAHFFGDYRIDDIDGLGREQLVAVANASRDSIAGSGARQALFRDRVPRCPHVMLVIILCLFCSVHER